MSETRYGKIKSISVLIVCGFFLSLPAYGDGRSDTRAGEMTKEPGEFQNVLLYFENDIFSGTDEHYTNAVKISYLSKDLREYDELLPSWMMPAVRKVPFIRRFSEQAPKPLYNVGLSAGHKIYTPTNITREDLSADDRPYAGWLYFSMALHRKSLDRLDSFETTLGMVGPSAAAEEIQNTVHETIGSDRAEGWENQLKDELGVLLSWQQSRRIMEKGLDAGFGFDVIPHYGATLGNVYTYLNAGGEIRFGYNLPGDFGTPLIRPAATYNSPYFQEDRKRNESFGIHLFFGAEGRAVAQNIFLDGNTWKDSHSVDKKYFVADLFYGISLTYKTVKLTYSQAYRTEEFKEQGGGQSFGSMSLSYAF